MFLTSCGSEVLSPKRARMRVVTPGSARGVTQGKGSSEASGIIDKVENLGRGGGLARVSPIVGPEKTLESKRYFGDRVTRKLRRGFGSRQAIGATRKPLRRRNPRGLRSFVSLNNGQAKRTFAGSKTLKRGVGASRHS